MSKSIFSGSAGAPHPDCTDAAPLAEGESPASRFPKLIWQTYKSVAELPDESLPCIRSWTSLNPEWTYQFCSDADNAEFFQTFFSADLFALYDLLPLGVMKADLWRYAVLWEFGGIYTDIDTVCLEPLDGWLDVEEGMGLQVACERGNPLFCQWTIASRRHHPALAHAIDLIAERVKETGGVDESMPHYVHHYTGPGLWTAAIQRYLGSDEGPEKLCKDQVLQARNDMAIHPGNFFDGLKSRHLNASFRWQNSPSGYASWLKERKDFNR